MSNKEVEKVAQHVTEARATAADITRWVAATSDPQEIREAADRVKVAREWAKVHKIAAEMRSDLMRLEIACYKRICELGAISVLGPSHRPAAKWFSGLSDEDVDSLLDEYGKASTATAIYRAVQRGDLWAKEKTAGGAFASGDADVVEEDEEFERRMWKYQQTDVRAAIATVLDDMAATPQGYSIAAMVDDVIDLLPTNPGDPERLLGDAAFREGVAEVCRAAVRRSPSSMLQDMNAPRFVTCFSDESERFMRIPFENATLAQLRSMIAMRREQLAQDASALTRLEELEALLATPGAKPSDNLLSLSFLPSERVAS